MVESSDGSAVTPSALVGRAADLDLIRLLTADTSRGPSTLLVLGEPGVGKTALLTAAAQDCDAGGTRVLTTVGVQYRAQAGYTALRQLLLADPGLRAEVAATPILASALDARSGAVRGLDSVADMVVQLLSRLAVRVPVLVVVDDVQWLDRASAMVLAQVARRLAGTGAVLLAAARSTEGGFFDRSGLPLHELAPLNRSDSEELLSRHFPALSAGVRRRLMNEAQGNPLALLELPAALTHAQQSRARMLPPRLALTQRLQEAFASRITGLPPATRHLLLVAALEGSGNLQVLRRAVAGRCDLKHLAPAERVQLVHIDEVTGRLEFRHSLMRSAVVDLATSDQRRSAHRALAEAWGAVPEQRAWHLAQAAVDPDEHIAALLEEVADLSATRGDGPDAVTALVRAAELSPAAAERARRLAKAAYMGANLTGGLLDVPWLLDDARRVAPGADSPAMAVAAALYLLNSHGDVDTAHRLLRGAIMLQPQPYDLSDATLREALATLLMVCVYGGRAELWEDFDRALGVCVAVPDTLRLLRATFADPVRARPDDWAELDAAIAGLAGCTDPIRIVRVGTAAAYADRLGDMAEPLLRTARGGRGGANNFPAIQASFLWGSHAWSTGRWDELRQVVGAGLKLCDEYHYPLRSFTGRWALGCVSAACGDYPAARAAADRMDQWADSRRAHAVRCYAAHVRALSALSQGDFEDAYRHACTITPAGSLAPFAGHALWTLLDLVEAAVGSGHRAEAAAHVQAVRDARLAAVSPRLAMVLHACTALVAQDSQESESAFAEALAGDGCERWPFDRARIQLGLGERLRRGGRDRRGGRRYLSEAAETFARLGADPWTARAQRELRACGAPATTRPGLGVDPLTSQQRQIATLAAAGLSNREIGERLFLSPRTVSTHLYRVFPKLGITSRAALRDALDQHAEA